MTGWNPSWLVCVEWTNVDRTSAKQEKPFEPHLKQLQPRPEVRWGTWLQIQPSTMAGSRINVHRKRKKKTITSTNVLFDGSHLRSPGMKLGFIPEQKRWTQGGKRLFFAPKSLKNTLDFHHTLQDSNSYFKPEMQLIFRVFISDYTCLLLFLVTMVKGRVVATHRRGGPTAPFRYHRDFFCWIFDIYYFSFASFLSSTGSCQDNLVIESNLYWFKWVWSCRNATISNSLKLVPSPSCLASGLKNIVENLF